MVPEVSYLGHRIDANGLHPLEDKVKAILEAPSPRNASELKSYPGLLSYYGKFLPDLSSVLAPLYQLLRKHVSWRWSSVERDAFQASKDLLSSSSLLVHSDPQVPLTLACDASAYGVGAVLSHRLPDGSEHPVVPQTPPVVDQNPAGVATSSREIISQRYPQRSRPTDCYEPTLWHLGYTSYWLQPQVLAFLRRRKCGVVFSMNILKGKL